MTVLSQGLAVLCLHNSASSWHPSVNCLTPEILQLLPGCLLGPFPPSCRTHTAIPASRYLLSGPVCGSFDPAPDSLLGLLSYQTQSYEYRKHGIVCLQCPPATTLCSFQALFHSMPPTTFEVGTVIIDHPLQMGKRTRSSDPGAKGQQSPFSYLCAQWLQSCW